MGLKSEVDNIMKIIREFLNKLNIGYKCRSYFITLRLSKENLKIVQLFYEKNWIKHYSINNEQIFVYLRYVRNKPLFTKIEFISTPGYRRYFSKESLSYFKKNKGGNARVLLFTSFGLLGIKVVQDLSIGGEISYILYG